MKNRKDLRKRYSISNNTKKNSNSKKNKKPTNDISAPERAKGGRAYRFYIRNNETLKRYIDILKIRYCEDLVQFYNIFWNVTTDSTGNITIQTQVKVREKKRTNISNIDVDTQPKDLQTLYVVTIIHANLTVLVHGKSRDKWIEHEYPLLKAVYKYSLQDKTSTLFECYCFILGINIFQHQLPLQEVNIKDELIQDDSGEDEVEKTDGEKILDLLAKKNDSSKCIESPMLPPPLTIQKRNKKKEKRHRSVCVANEKELLKENDQNKIDVRRRKSNENNSAEDLANITNHSAENTANITKYSAENTANNTKHFAENTRNMNIETITSIGNAVKEMDAELRYWISSYKADKATQEQELKTVMEHVVTLLIKGTRKLRCKVDRLTESVKKQNAEIHELKEQNQKKINHHKNEFQNAITYLMEEINELKKEIKKKNNGDNDDDIREIEKHYSGDEMACNKLELLQQHNDILDSSHARGLHQKSNDDDDNDDEATNLLALLDSNSKCTPFYKLFPDKVFNIIPCKSIKAAKNILAVSRQNDVTIQTHDILLDIGTDDLERHHPERVALDLCQVAEDFKDAFQCKTYVSALSTERTNLKDLVEHANALIQQILVNKGDGNIVLLNHDEDIDTKYEIEETGDEEEDADPNRVEEENEDEIYYSEDNDESTEAYDNHVENEENAKYCSDEEEEEETEESEGILNHSEENENGDDNNSKDEDEENEEDEENYEETTEDNEDDNDDNDTIDFEEMNENSSGTDISFTDFYVKSITTMSHGMTQLTKRLSATTKNYEKIKETAKVERKKSAEQLERKKSAEKVDRKRSAEIAERRQSLESAERKRSAENEGRKKSAENVERKRSAENIARVRPVEYVERIKPMDLVERIRPSENGERIRPADYVESIKAAGKVERVKAENVDADHVRVQSLHGKETMQYYENNTKFNTKGIKAFSYEIWKEEQNSLLDNFTSTYV